MQKEARLAKLKAELDSRGGLPDIPSDILAYFLQRFSPAWLARSVCPHRRCAARATQHGTHKAAWRVGSLPAVAVLAGAPPALFVCLFFVWFSFVCFATLK